MFIKLLARSLIDLIFTMVRRRHVSPANSMTKLRKPTCIWLAKWCKIHKVYIHSHSMLLLMFTNIFIHIQQPNLHSRNIFMHIYLCISYPRLYLLTFTRCLHSHSTSYIHSHSRSKYSFNIFCASPLRICQ